MLTESRIQENEHRQKGFPRSLGRLVLHQALGAIFDTQTCVGPCYTDRPSKRMHLCNYDLLHFFQNHVIRSEVCSLPEGAPAKVFLV